MWQSQDGSLAYALEPRAAAQCAQMVFGCGANICSAATMMICIGNTALHRIKRRVRQAARAQRAVVLCR